MHLISMSFSFNFWYYTRLDTSVQVSVAEIPYGSESPTLVDAPAANDILTRTDLILPLYLTILYQLSINAFNVKMWRKKLKNKYRTGQGILSFSKGIYRENQRSRCLVSIFTKKITNVIWYNCSKIRRNEEKIWICGEVVLPNHLLCTVSERLRWSLLTYGEAWFHFVDVLIFLSGQTVSRLDQETNWEFDSRVSWASSSCSNKWDEARGLRYSLYFRDC